ncbi:hypothetical protein SEVIR_5G036250v4 [Setaria viridis]|uniref:Uncharacterized protein n=1 Tax=Setaria viridis TaxID=4556 RepID=A0A4U6UCK4_SETVI|nr:hypothetical protein SEVIR_5G036250v2 [Setaria viridis]
MPTSLLGSGSEEDCCWCDAALPFPRRRDLPCAPSIHPSSSGTTRRGAGVSTGKIPSSTCCTSSSHSKCCAKRIQMLGLPFCNVAVGEFGCFFLMLQQVIFMLGLLWFHVVVGQSGCCSVSLLIFCNNKR